MDLGRLGDLSPKRYISGRRGMMKEREQHLALAMGGRGGILLSSGHCSAIVFVAFFCCLLPIPLLLHFQIHK
jgi:hypothetical protein